LVGAGFCGGLVGAGFWGVLVGADVATTAAATEPTSAFAF
jgi:hypothetical protein